MSQSGKAAKTVFIMIIFAFGSKLLGFISEMLIAAKFGSGIETDTFFIAITAIGLFTTFLTKAISTTMIPILSEVESKEGADGKKQHTNNLLHVVILISFIIVILGWIAAPFIIRVLAHGFEGEQFNLAVIMMRIGLPVMFFAGVAGVFRGYLQSESMFTEAAKAQIPVKLTYIFFLIFLSNIFGIKGLMVTSVLAIGTQILIQIPGMRKTNYKYNFVFKIKDKYMQKIICLVPPVLISLSVGDLNKLVDRSLASTLVDGSISALNYASKLNHLILGVFISAITTVIFPMFSKEANRDSYDGFKRVVRYGINTILLITIPATIGMIVLAEPIVRIAFERGAYNVNDTYMTTGALVFYSLGLVGMSLKPLLNRAYYSLQDTKTPMQNGFISVGVNIVLNFILVKFMAHRGLALATSISTTVTTGLQLFGLKKKIGSIGIKKLIKCGLKSLSASLVMGLAVWFAYFTLKRFSNGRTIMELPILLLVSALGACIYLVIIYISKVEEIDWFIGILKNKLKKKKNRNSIHL